MGTKFNAGKIEFYYQYDNSKPKIAVTLHPDATLPEVLEAFEQFLLASGYSFSGNLDFIEED